MSAKKTSRKRVSVMEGVCRSDGGLGKGRVALSEASLHDAGSSPGSPIGANAGFHIGQLAVEVGEPAFLGLELRSLGSEMAQDSLKYPVQLFQLPGGGVWRMGTAQLPFNGAGFRQGFAHPLG